MALPQFIIACKNYELGIGSRLLAFAKDVEVLAEAKGVSIALAVNPIDLKSVAQEVNLPIIAQHVDAIDYGSHTGWIHPQAVKESGVHMTLLNHSEHRLPSDQVAHYLQTCFSAGLGVVLCAESKSEVTHFAQMYRRLATQFSVCPCFALAYEPPDLIGASDVSVASQNPDIVLDSVREAGDIPLIIGAGINRPEDIEVGMKLGARGFLVASAICKASDPLKKLESLVQNLSS